MNSKSDQLYQLSKSIVSDEVCPELASSATQLVFGDGNPDAEVVFIGEAPGKKEDELGKPFVGAAGKFLDEMLGLIKLNRQDVYITNIVKYRPPNNRDPLPKEKKAFLPYLQRQLEVIQPKLLVTLGRHSATCFLPDLRISRDHGQPKRIKITANSNSLSSTEDNSVNTAQKNELPIVVLPLYHPAAALYNGGMRQTLIDDFQKIPTIINKLNSKTT